LLHRGNAHRIRNAHALLEANCLDPDISMGLHAAQPDANASEALQHPALSGDRATLASSRHRDHSDGLPLTSNTGLVLESASAMAAERSSEAHELILRGEQNGAIGTCYGRAIE
jgi:hypothetical protein